MSYKIKMRNDETTSDKLGELIMLERHDYYETADGRVTREEELARYLIGDALVRMKDKWAKRIDRREAFEFFFGSCEWGDSLEYWCDVAGMRVETVREIATMYYLRPVLINNPMKQWCDV